MGRNLRFLWGIDQLFLLGGLVTTLGDVVIMLHVLDLGWLTPKIVSNSKDSLSEI